MVDEPNLRHRAWFLKGSDSKQSSDLQRRTSTASSCGTYVQVSVAEILGQHLGLEELQLLFIHNVSAVDDFEPHLEQQPLLECCFRRVLDQEEGVVHASRALERDDDPEQERHT
jgi:hypothetical protein